jgi:M6 family metalloprotease-like protein
MGKIIRQTVQSPEAYDNSYGKLTYQVNVYGPYTLSQNIAYYDYKSGVDYHRLPEAAILIADQNGCDFSQYDSNDDGVVDGVHIIFADYSQAILGDAGQGNSI